MIDEPSARVIAVEPLLEDEFHPDNIGVVVHERIHRPPACTDRLGTRRAWNHVSGRYRTIRAFQLTVLRVDCNAARTQNLFALTDFAVLAFMKKSLRLPQGYPYGSSEAPPPDLGHQKPLGVG